MKKIKTFLLALAIIGLNVSAIAQTGIYKGNAQVACPALGLDVSLDGIDVILKTSGSKYKLVIDEIDLGGGSFVPYIEIPNVTATPSGANYALAAPQMVINIPKVTVSGMTLTNVPATVTLKNGLVAGETLTLNLEVTAMSIVTITIGYSGTKTDNPLEGGGTIGKPWLITKISDFIKLEYMVYACSYCYLYKHFKLSKDMDFTDQQSTEPWTPIGFNPNSAFSGNFDGNNKKIIGLKIKDNPDAFQQFVGLFGYVGGGSIINLGLEDVVIEVENKLVDIGEIYIGGVAAYLGYDSKISNCYVTGKMKNSAGNGAYYTGGIAGAIFDQSKISDCYSTAEVSSSSETYAVAGGVVGHIRASAISNCYSTGEVSSFSGNSSAAGGVAGEIGENYGTTGAKISDCAALNPGINCTGAEKNFGRLVGKYISTPIDTLAQNVAFDEMTNPDGETTWENVCLVCLDGANITKEEISADGTIGNRFIAKNGWTTANQKLPGLFGSTVNMPDFLNPLGIAGVENVSSIQVYPNPTTGELKMENGELRIENVEIFDVYGKKLSSFTSHSSPLISIDISHLSNGVYFLRIQTEQGMITKKIVKI